MAAVAAAAAGALAECVLFLGGADTDLLVFMVFVVVDILDMVRFLFISLDG